MDRSTERFCSPRGFLRLETLKFAHNDEEPLLCSMVSLALECEPALIPGTDGPAPRACCDSLPSATSSGDPDFQLTGLTVTNMTISFHSCSMDVSLFDSAVMQNSHGMQPKNIFPPCESSN
ncbi:unnamed protein product [Tetraodon nigroviridis]|uniref:Chromosome 11 SCAF14479, whole genome shotgun sequence n=1 Tax=Tetraodon nigroviridis TaxID=99883 RepID=Q4SSA6_TETNG|nr:unnamed protein product [Tetraodon nigroviridis]